MIQLFLNSGLDVLRYGLQNGSVRLFLAAELVFVLLGAVCGVLARSGRRQFICLSVPGVLGCALFLYIHSDLGRMALTDAHIWLRPWQRIWWHSPSSPARSWRSGPGADGQTAGDAEGPASEKRRA